MKTNFTSQALPGGADDADEQQDDPSQAQESASMQEAASESLVLEPQEPSIKKNPS